MGGIPWLAQLGDLGWIPADLSALVTLGASRRYRERLLAFMQVVSERVAVLQRDYYRLLQVSTRGAPHRQ